MKVRLMLADETDKLRGFKNGDIFEVVRYSYSDGDWMWAIKGTHFLLNPNSCEIYNEQQTDTIVESVTNQFKERSEVGINKYGVTLDRNDLTTLEWIEHAKQELMDGILYLEKLKQQLS